MPELNTVESTLFIPLLGRIYATEHCPKVLDDQKAVALKTLLPVGLVERDMQRHSQYTLLASAVRSANMDQIVSNFLERNPNGVVVQLGCGLETAFYRSDSEQASWYAVDLPEVIDYRKKLLPEPDREHYIPGDAFDGAWLAQVETDHPNDPLLVTAGGLFHYFKEQQVIDLMRMLQKRSSIELAFDAVNRRGMAALKRKYLKQMGHGEATMSFYVNSADDLAQKLGGSARVLSEDKYFGKVDRSGLTASTRMSMTLSDCLNMVKIVRLEL